MHLYQKITGIAATLFLLVLVVSCSDDEEVVKEDQLVGSWSLTSQEVKNIQITIEVAGVPATVPIDGFLNDEQQEILDTLDILPEDVVLTFAEDQTYTGSSASAGSAALAGTWTLSEDGKQLTITGLDQAAQLLGTSSLTFEVQNFTDTDLSLLASVSDISLDQFDVDELENATISGDYQLDLKKQ